jgi:hypothetical protein
MAFEKVTGSNLGYYLIPYDENGIERSEHGNGSDCFLSEVALDQFRDNFFTDVFIMSHGWKGDIPAARDQYQRWIGAMALNSHDGACMRSTRPRFSPLIIGLHWPSQPWGDEELANAGGQAFAMDSASTASAVSIYEHIDRYASRIADTPRARTALATIFDAALADITPRHLPDNVRQAYEILNAEAGIGSEGEAAPPGSDRETFDAERFYQLARSYAMSYGGAGSLGILELLRQLSFWKMKRRALLFGENGARDLLTKLLHAASSDIHVHLMGHSFGCIVVSAMLGGAYDPVRPVSSLVLVQGALSSWSYCEDIPTAPGKQGYFHSIVSKNRVQGPIVATLSRYDGALSKYYPLGAGLGEQVTYSVGMPPRYAAVGAYGIAGIDEYVHHMDMLDSRSAYDFLPGHVYNLESSAYICHGDGPSGAHSDIAKAEVAHAVWQAACGQSV